MDWAKVAPICGTWHNCSAVARSTRAGEPNCSKSAAVSRGPRPGTRCSVSKSLVSGESGADIGPIGVGGVAFTQDVFDLFVVDVSEQGRFTECLGQDQPQSTGDRFLVVSHHREKVGAGPGPRRRW